MLTTDRKKIAIIPSFGLGDGLLSCVLADNLAKNNCEVSLFNNLVAKLDHWIPFIDCQRLPISSDVLDSYDLIYICGVARESLSAHVLSGLESKLVVYKETLVRKQAYFNEKMTGCCDSNTQFSLQSFYANAGISLTHHNLAITAVENVVNFCKNQLNLKKVNKQVRLNISLSLKKKNNYIIIHPDSSIYKKNWAPNKYLNLATRLVKQGFDVVFSVAPHEYTKWNAIIQERFRLTGWSLDELARELCQARLFIGSDSGSGHLASMLGTPTITIFIRKRTHYTWRPGWSKGYIVHPALPLSILKAKDHQRSPLSVGKVLSVCNMALNETKLKIVS